MSDMIAEHVMQLADALYGAGYVARLKGRDYNPRECEAWQDVVEALTAPAGWLPIETAEKPSPYADGFGKRVLLTVDCGDGSLASVRKGFWDGQDWFLDCCGAATEYGYRVTHWMPLIAPANTAATLAQEESDYPIKYYKKGGVIYAVHGTSSINFVERLLAEIADLTAAPAPAERHTESDVSALVEESIRVVYVDGVGAGRNRPEDCRDGIDYITVADTVYWPLSAEDAQLLRSAACGKGQFTGPSTSTNVEQLVEALELARRTLAMAALEGEATRRIDSALAAHHKQQETSYDNQ